MIYKTKTVVLKNGQTAILRSPSLDDAKELAEFIKKCASETYFILRSPEECKETVEQEAAFIDAFLTSSNMLMIVCEVNGKIAGNCQLTFKNKIKNSHRCSIGIGILKAYWNLGIGTFMFEELIKIAQDRKGIKQIELEFIEGNDRAKALYEKMGFSIVSYKPDAIMLEDGTLLKEYFMMKRL